MSQTPDTSRDEEIARGLQVSEKMAATHKADVGGGGGSGAPGTYVSMPPSMMAFTGVEITPPPAVVEEEEGEEGEPVATATAPQHHVASAVAASPESSAMMHAKMSFLVKAISVACFVWWAYSVAFRAWWFVFDCGFIFCPVGWLGAHRGGSPRLSFAFCLWLVADLVFQVLFPFIYAHLLHAVAMVVCLLMIVFQVLAAFYTWRFTQMLRSRASGHAFTLDTFL